MGLRFVGQQTADGRRRDQLSAPRTAGDPAARITEKLRLLEPCTARSSRDAFEEHDGKMIVADGTCPRERAPLLHLLHPFVSLDEIIVKVCSKKRC
jgi:hypothetical protein